MNIAVVIIFLLYSCLFRLPRCQASFKSSVKKTCMATLDCRQTATPNFCCINEFCCRWNSSGGDGCVDSEHCAMVCPNKLFCCTPNYSCEMNDSYSGMEIFKSLLVIILFGGAAYYGYQAYQAFLVLREMYHRERTPSPGLPDIQLERRRADVLGEQLLLPPNPTGPTRTYQANPSGLNSGGPDDDHDDNGRIPLIRYS